MKHRSKRFLSILLTLALVLGLLPGMSLTAYAATLDSSSTTWSEDSTIESDMTISSGVTVSADITLTIPAGKTLTVNGGINANGHTLTVNGAGTLTVNGANGANGADSDGMRGGNGANGSAGFTGTLIIDGATVNVTGGNGGYGDIYGGNGGNGAAGISGNITVNSGSATVTGGAGGTGGIYTDVAGRSNGSAGSASQAVSGSITATTAEESDDNSTWTAISGTTSTKQYVKVEGAATVAVTGVTLNPSAAQKIGVGGTVKLTATVSPSDATDKTVKWSVSGAAVKLYADAACTQEVGTRATETLTVYAKGMSVGSATVTATSNANSNKYASCAVTVQDVPETGDGADFGLWAALLAVGLSGIGLALTMGKRGKARQ
ncbi:MAG: Ig-like domain-containing protein [Clostridia bacterium]|nr:Ig-like domain-containing protein [Clostridia bacterium]